MPPTSPVPPESFTPPPPRTPGRYRVGFVCLGNICRSPVADVVLSSMVEQAGLADRVEVASCGTGPWHVGEPMDRRSAATLAGAGYDPTRHVARQYDAATWPGDHDLLLAMDAHNLADIGGRGPRTALLGDLDPRRPGAEVPDPYYGGPTGFEEVLAMVERSCAELTTGLTTLLSRLSDASHDGAAGAPGGDA